MFQHRYNMFPSDSQLWSFMTLFTARAGSAACVIIGKTATATQRRNNTTQNKAITPKLQETYTPIHPGYRASADYTPIHPGYIVMRHCNTIDWSFQDSNPKEFSCTPKQKTFSRSFQRCTIHYNWQAEPRVGEHSQLFSNGTAGTSLRARQLHKL